jgi:hypothetical protein
MPRSEYLVSKLDALIAEYRHAFPKTKFPAKFALSTHITPCDRPKKLYFHMPTCDDIPAVIMTLHRDAAAPRSRVVAHLTNMMTDTHVTRRMTVAQDKPDVNRRAIDRVLRMLRKELWVLGKLRRLDHASE